MVFKGGTLSEPNLELFRTANVFIDCENGLKTESEDGMNEIGISNNSTTSNPSMDFIGNTLNAVTAAVRDWYVHSNEGTDHNGDRQSSNSTCDTNALEATGIFLETSEDNKVENSSDYIVL